MNPLKKQLSRFFRSVHRLFERRDFRSQIRKEKTKKYLFQRPASSHDVILKTLSDPRKRFHFISTFYSKLESEKNRFSVFFSALGILTLLLSLYIILGSPYFRISPAKVIIERLDSWSDVNIAYKSIEKIYGKPIFSIGNQKVAEMIIETQKNIRQAEVGKLYPNGFKIILSSYPSEFSTYFPHSERYYGITGNGILIYEHSKPTELPILDIIDASLVESEFLDYKEGVPATKMERIIRIRKILGIAFPGINVSKYAFFRTEQELHIFFESGIRILISLDGTEDLQLEKLRFWNSENGGALGKGGFSYGDLRIPGKVFFCREESTCKKNLIRIYGNYYLR